MLRTYVRIAHMKIEIQKSVKNPYVGVGGHAPSQWGRGRESDVDAP
jgi:hypothetical protein